MRRHGRAAFSASTADFRATHHLGIAHRLAVLGALAAHFCAGSADRGVDIGATKHCRGARSADVGAAREQRNVLWCCVLAALGKAVVDGLQADRVALRAVVDALVHGLGPVFG